jgi:hypothetical protein
MAHRGLQGRLSIKTKVPRNSDRREETVFNRSYRKPPKMLGSSQCPVRWIQHPLKDREATDIERLVKV